MDKVQDPYRPRYLLPTVDDAVLAYMSGANGLSQAQLWQALGDTHVGNLSAWALGEAARLEAEGASPRDAFLGGVGYAVVALTRQLGREADKEKVAAILATFSLEKTP